MVTLVFINEFNSDRPDVKGVKKRKSYLGKRPSQLIDSGYDVILGRGTGWEHCPIQVFKQGVGVFFRYRKH